MNPHNPFPYPLLHEHDRICGRGREIFELTRYAVNRANVVLYGPKRIGKTTLVRKLHSGLRKRGYVPVLCDCFRVLSEEDLARRLAAALFGSLRERDHLWRLAERSLRVFRPELRAGEAGRADELSVVLSSGMQGIDLLDATLSEACGLIAAMDEPAHLVFDEFQHLALLRSSQAVEQALVRHLSRAGCGIFFVGSQKDVFLPPFTQKGRPLHRFGVSYGLDVLPRRSSRDYIRETFEKSGKTIVMDQADLMCELTQCHPYGLQLLARFVYERSQDTVTDQDVHEAFRVLLATAGDVFGPLLEAMTLPQIRLLVALAREPTAKIYSLAYMARHGLGSVGGIQKSVKYLTHQELIGKSDGAWRVIDPLLQSWLLWSYPAS
jgi:hypothetical protein